MGVGVATLKVTVVSTRAPGKYGVRDCAFVDTNNDNELVLPVSFSHALLLVQWHGASVGDWAYRHDPSNLLASEQVPSMSDCQ